MKKYLPNLAAAFIFAVSAAIVLMPAQAASHSSFLQLGKSSAIQVQALKRVDYYGDDHYREEYYDYEDRHYPRKKCGYTRYRKKYVCEKAEPRCFKQRKCIWYYGREYCRYIRKCIRGERYCKWIRVPVRKCGYGNSW